MPEKLTRQKIAQDLERLGIRKGDVVYARASLKSMGEIDGEYFDTVVGGFLDAVGPEGTVMVPAFTKIGNIFSKNIPVFDLQSVPYTGAFSKLFLRHPQAVRSFHPTHSFVAVGPAANKLLGDHRPNSPCFFPVKRLAEMDGKMLYVGCNNESPGFSTVHFAQYELGLSQRHWIRHLQRAQFREYGKLHQWRPIESPGCSLSFDKFYRYYMREQNFFTGYVGKGYAVYVPSSYKALVTDLEILKRQPTFSDCERAACLTCGFRGYQLWKLPRTILAAAWSRLFQRVH